MHTHAQSDDGALHGFFFHLIPQKEVVYKKKESFFSLEETEFRQPAVLVLQVWDYDRIASNDFLGEAQSRDHQRLLSISIKVIVVVFKSLIKIVCPGESRHVRSR